MARDSKGNLIVKHEQSDLAKVSDVGSEIIDIMEITKRVLSNPKITYSNDNAGFEAFRYNSISYLEYVQKINASGNIKKQIIPDIEGWTNYIGITPHQLRYMRKTRGEKWVDLIDQMKNGISACKKQLALNGQISPVMAIFDLTNNHGYINSNEFKIDKSEQVENKQALTMTEIQEKYGSSSEIPTLPIEE